MVWTWEDRDREVIVYDYWQIRRLSHFTLKKELAALQGSVRIFNTVKSTYTVTDHGKRWTSGKEYICERQQGYACLSILEHCLL